MRKRRREEQEKSERDPTKRQEGLFTELIQRLVLVAHGVVCCVLRGVCSAGSVLSAW